MIEIIAAFIAGAFGIAAVLLGYCLNNRKKNHDVNTINVENNDSYEIESHFKKIVRTTCSGLGIIIGSYTAYKIKNLFIAKIDVADVNIYSFLNEIITTLVWLGIGIGLGLLAAVFLSEMIIKKYEK